MELIEKLKIIFKRDKQCIINADLDGILSGLILHNFLNWEIVGFSSCSGSITDELWLDDTLKTNIFDCVFIDLPVALKNVSVIDQHFVATTKHDVESYSNEILKINPNILRSRVFSNNNISEYTKKYPFGTVHFIIACLERLNIIPKDFHFDFLKKIENFDLADLILRADRVISNTFQYTTNCIDWSNWISSLGGTQTNILFDKVKTEYSMRVQSEKNVEDYLKRLGCTRADGDYSNMIRDNNIPALNNYFKFLADSIGLKTIPTFKTKPFKGLSGERYSVSTSQPQIPAKLLNQESLFSFAYVTMRDLSITYLKKSY